MSDSIPVTPTDTGARNTSVPTPSGKLKDAEDIEWYYSESSITPMNVSDQRKYGSKQKSRSRSPAAVVAGSRRAQRKRKPTWKAAGEDPLDATISTRSGAKKLAAQTISDFFASRPRATTSESVHTSDRDVSSASGSAFEGEDGGDSESDDLEEDIDEEEHVQSKRTKRQKLGPKSGSDVEDEAARYERLRANVAQETDYKHAKRAKDDRTKDVRASVFEAGSRKSKDGSTSQGHWCRVCISQGRNKDDCWFTGGVSSLRSHIDRKWSTHGEVYLQGCKKVGVEPNWRALQNSSANKNTQATSTNGSESITKFVHLTPKWTQEGLLDHIIELFVSNDLSFNLIEKGSFRRLLKYQHPGLKEKDIPHRSKIADAIRERAAIVQDRLRDELKNVPGQISITFDSWTSGSMDPYLSVTAHYISTTPAQWMLKSRLLAYEPIEGNHSGANTAAVLLRVVDRYGFRGKLGWATADNAANMDRRMRIVERCIKSENPRWIMRKRRVRCMEHIGNLAAEAFIKTACPQPMTFRKSRKAADEDDSECSDLEDDPTSDGDSDSEQTNFDPKDVIGKLHALIVQIRASPQARAYFETVCKEESIKPLQLLKWVRTRWGSMYDMIDRAHMLQAALNKFCQNADASSKVPRLKNKEYIDYLLTRQEWEALSLIREVLREVRELQSSFSAEKTTTVWKALPTLDCLQDRWETMANNRKFTPVAEAIEAGLAKIRKYYGALDDVDFYFICLVLNPSIKSKYTEKKWEVGRHQQGLAAFERTFDEYARHHVDSTSISQSGESDSQTERQASSTVIEGMAKIGLRYGATWLQEALADSFETGQTQDPRQELRRYLQAPLSKDVDDVVQWWDQHATEYPVLARMALDYLAIQGSSVASERAFSSGGRTGTKLRNRLKPDTFQAVQLLKDGYRTGMITAVEQASLHEELTNGYIQQEYD